MEGMVKNLSKYGGDIIKFVGDALIIMWPSPTDPTNLAASMMPPDDGTPIQHFLMKETIRKSVQCALEIQSHMNNMQIMPGLTLSVKVRSQYPAYLCLDWHRLRQMRIAIRGRSSRSIGVLHNR